MNHPMNRPIDRPLQPVLDKRGEPHVRRFEEQRWLLDNIIRANGIDWDSRARSISAAPAATRPTPISPASASG